MRIALSLLVRIPCLLLFLGLLAGCTDKGRIPSGVIPQEEMGKILWDMVQADQFSSYYLAKDSTNINWKDSVQTLRKDSLQAALRADSAGLLPKDPAKAKTKDSARPATENPRPPKVPVKIKTPLRLITAKDSARQKAEDSLRISQLKASFRDGLKMKTLKLYQQVFQLHQVTLEEFRKSYQYYMERPDIAKVMIDSVLARGNRLRADAYSHPVTDTAKKSPTPGGTAPGQLKPITPAALPPPPGGVSPGPSSTFLLRARNARAKTGKDSVVTKSARP